MSNPENAARQPRRKLAAILLLGLLAGCTSAGLQTDEPAMLLTSAARMYGAVPQERFAIPAVRLAEVNPRYYRREVDYQTTEKPGTIVVDRSHRYLYLVLDNGRALRYGIGIGRQGFSWDGRARIARKRAWPTWTPPTEMIEREPELEEYKNGMEPGLANPLGARALYLYQGNRDTLYRIHGTSEARSIGKAVSSGCIRLLNQDVIDLANRVKTGAEVVVI